MIAPQLSRRERETLFWMGQGKGATDIAIILSLSVKTISTYRRRLLDKLQFENSSQLVRFAILEDIEEAVRRERKDDVL